MTNAELADLLEELAKDIQEADTPYTPCCGVVFADDQHPDFQGAGGHANDCVVQRALEAAEVLRGMDGVEDGEVVWPTVLRTVLGSICPDCLNRVRGLSAMDMLVRPIEEIDS